MKKIIMIVSMVLLSVSGALAQKAAIYPFDINGVKYGEKYTDAQMRQFFGEPTEFYVNDESSNGYIEIKTVYKYHDPILNTNDFIKHDSRYGINGFTINTPRFKLYGGRVKIGDNLSVFNSLGGGLLVQVKYGESIFFDLGVETDEYLVIDVDSMNRITCLSMYFLY